MIQWLGCLHQMYVSLHLRLYAQERIYPRWQFLARHTGSTTAYPRMTLRALFRICTCLPPNPTLPPYTDTRAQRWTLAHQSLRTSDCVSSLQSVLPHHYCHPASLFLLSALCLHRPPGRGRRWAKEVWLGGSFSLKAEVCVHDVRVLSLCTKSWLYAMFTHACARACARAHTHTHTRMHTNQANDSVCADCSTTQLMNDSVVGLSPRTWLMIQ